MSFQLIKSGIEDYEICKSKTAENTEIKERTPDFERIERMRKYNFGICCPNFTLKINGQDYQK